MQDILNILSQVAGLGAVLLTIAAIYQLYRMMRARKDSRSALFGAERQSAADRAIRALLTAFGMFGSALVLLGIALLGAPAAEGPIKPQGTSAPVSTTSTKPLATQSTPVTGSQPGQATNTPLGSDAPAVLPSPTPAPPTPTPETGQERKTAVVSGVGDNLLKLRREPTTLADIIAQYPDGTVLEVVDEQQTSQGIVWQHVRDTQGNEGWVANQYLVYNP
ncbi:MAG: SH3 domain-containing protein [Thermoflexales bacterium]|nr:SH3 domain-containing protein [Thermoflexales bacterium]